MLKTSPKFLKTVTFVILIIGIALRINVYVQNRSLTIDEANLARNIYEKEISELFKKLDYEQYAPPVFTTLIKGSTMVFGVNEYSLRLMALIGGLASLIILFLILKELLTNDLCQWYAMLLFSFSYLAIRYSTEVKQYSTDTAICLFFIYWAIRTKDKEFGLSQFLIWSILGAISIWMSMPIIFILAAIGIAFLSIKIKKKELGRIVIMGTIWLTSFAYYFYTILYTDIRTDKLQDFHHSHFFNFFPNSIDSFSQSYTIIEGLFRLATDKTSLSISVAILLFFIGSYHLIRKKPFVSILLLLPILLTLVASQLHLYSLIERMSLFLIPFFILIISIGLSWLWSRSNSWLKITLGVFLLFSVINKKGYSNFWSKVEFENSKSIMAYLSEHRLKDETIYIEHSGIPAFIFYNDMHDRAWNFENYFLAKWEDRPSKELFNSSNKERFWLFFSHTFPQERIQLNIESALEISSLEKKFIKEGASVYCFQFGQK